METRNEHRTQAIDLIARAEEESPFLVRDAVLPLKMAGVAERFSVSV